MVEKSRIKCLTYLYVKNSKKKSKQEIGLPDGTKINRNFLIEQKIIGIVNFFVINFFLSLLGFLDSYLFV